MQKEENKKTNQENGDWGIGGETKQVNSYRCARMKGGFGIGSRNPGRVGLNEIGTTMATGLKEATRRGYNWRSSGRRDLMIEGKV